MRREPLPPLPAYPARPTFSLKDMRLSHSCALLARVNGALMDAPIALPFGQALREAADALAWALRGGNRDAIDRRAVELAALALSLALPEAR